MKKFNWRKFINRFVFFSLLISAIFLIIRLFLAPAATMFLMDALKVIMF